MSTETIQPPQPAQTFWIDKRDHLPDDNMLVLVYCPRADDSVWVGYIEAELWYTGEGIPLDNLVTHWADLPEPPSN